MTRCKGTTLKGERCKREAHTGLGYCTIHEDQAPAGAAREPRSTECDTDALLKTALGFALLGAILLFRLRR